MKAITIYEPWASLIALGEKKIETRSWATKHRGALFIHAGAATKYTDLGFKEPFFTALKPSHSTINGNNGPTTAIGYYPGCIMAISTLVDCVEITPEFIATLSEKEIAFGDYTLGRYAWILDHVSKLEFTIPIKGKQRIWNFGEDKK